MSSSSRGRRRNSTDGSINGVVRPRSRNSSGGSSINGSSGGRSRNLSGGSASGRPRSQNASGGSLPTATRFIRCQVLLQKLDEETICEINNRKYCNLCHRSPSDPLLYGKIYTVGGVTVHYYCLLFACHLAQKGEDTDGVFGFLEGDIKKEVQRAKSEICSYCEKGGATIICVQRMCKKVFHLPCGLENGSQHNYYNKFQSFCRQHRPQLKIPLTFVLEVEPAICAICMDETSRDKNCITSLWAPCCKKNSWLHRTCVQKYALSSGYFFKCPRCNDKDEFRKAMLRYGVYVPEKDASWELEGNQFGGLYERYSHCDAETCLCPMGRDEDMDDTDWEVILCAACGSQGIHVGCSKFKSALRKWYCIGCKPIVQKGPPDASTSALLNSLIFDSELPGPSYQDPEPPTIEPPAIESTGEAAAAVTERLPALPTSPPQDCSQYSIEAIDITISEEEEVDVEILEEYSNPVKVQAGGEEIQEVYRISPPSNHSCVSGKRPRWAIILDDDEGNDTDGSEPEVLEEKMEHDFISSVS